MDPAKPPNLAQFVYPQQNTVNLHDRTPFYQKCKYLIVEIGFSAMGSRLALS